MAVISYAANDNIDILDFGGIFTQERLKDLRGRYPFEVICKFNNRDEINIWREKYPLYNSTNMLFVEHGNAYWGFFYFKESRDAVMFKIRYA